MFKSFLCFFLVLVLCFTLSFSVFAFDLPENDINSSFTLDYFSLYIDYTQYKFSSLNLYYGDLYAFSFSAPSSDTTYSVDYSLDINLSLSAPCDVYFFTFIDGQNLNFDNFHLYPASYRNPSAGVNLLKAQLAEITSYTVSYYTGSYTRYLCSLDSSDNSISLSSGSGFYDNQVLYFGKIQSLPAGEAILTLETGSFQSSLSLDYPLGIFLDYQSSDDPIYDYENGISDFESAAQKIIDNMNSVLDDPESSDFEKQFAIQKADQQLNTLKNVSDSKYSYVVDSFSSDSSNIVESFIESSSFDILPSLSSLNSIFADALSQSSTIEQGILINSLYSVRLSELQTIFDVNYTNHLESIITDSDFENQTSYTDDINEAIKYQEEALLIFENSDYQSHLNFENWVVSFLSQNYHPVKDIYDFIFSDPTTSDLQPFLIVPFSLVLLSALLGTAVSISRGGRKHG